MRILLGLSLFLISFCLINLSTNIFAVTCYCLGHQRSSLLFLKNDLIFNHAKSKKLVSWNQSEDCCQWLGIKCSEGHVIALDLSQEFISGGLGDSSSLFSLQYLESLNLALNYFHSVIPPELHKLKNLRYLNLSNSGFTGQIPNEISHLRRLVTLDLSCSYTSHHRLKLERPNIAMLVQNLTDITELYLDGVAISAHGREWCHALSSLQELRVLSMSSCNLFGPIDSSLGKLQSLSVLKLSQNNISSLVPESFANFSNLTTLQLSNCFLSGVFPKDIFQIQTLKVLDISYNKGLHGSLPNFPQHGSLKALILSNTNFFGQLPDSISNLKQLFTLDLSNCQFNGTLPSSMSELTQLVYLDLSSNNFTGPLLSFNMSKNLTYISLFHNGLIGLLPSGHFEGLTNLISIDLGYNFLSGSVPSSLLKLPYLRELKLPYNQLSGLLGEFQNATSSALEMVDLCSNNLQGPIPMSIFNLRRLSVIQLSSNKFNGTIQLDIIQRLSNLATLDLSHNNLSIDSNFGDGYDLSLFPNMSNIMLASCKLKGIPSFLRNQSTLLYLDLSNNEIQGQIPHWIWQLEFLVHLNLSKNFLTNLEGNSWNLSSNLFVLDLHSNQLQGPIPFIPKIASYLDYSSNKFSSIIPSDIGNHLPFTTILSLSNNSFQGQIHESFCNASTLRLLDLSYNKFTGMIPDCLATLSSTLRVLNLSGNKLREDLDRYQGSVTIIDKGLPVKLVKIQRAFTYVDLSSNHFEGPLPTELAHFKALNGLNLSHNAFLGHIPSSFGNLKNLESLDLSNNSLSGEIPTELATLSFLSYMNLSFNQLEGRVPVGTQIQSFGADSFEGNEGLCGPPLTKNCSDDGVHGLSPLASETSHSHTGSSIDWNFLSAELGFTFGFGVVILSLILWKRWRLWYSKHVDDMLYKIIPQLDFVYEHRGGKKYRTLSWKRPY